MKLLSVDGSGEVLTMALGDGVLLETAGGPSKAPHDERLFPLLERLLARSGWSPADLDGIVVASGPGRFTGIRVAMTFSSVLGKVLDRPVLVVSRFEAAAYASIGQVPAGKEVWVALAGVREEIFLQPFRAGRSGMTPRKPPAWLKLADAGAALGPGEILLCGPAAPTLAAVLGERAVVAGSPSDPGAAGLLAPARSLFSRRVRRAFSPLYLKPAHYER